MSNAVSQNIFFVSKDIINYQKKGEREISNKKNIQLSISRIFDFNGAPERSEKLHNKKQQDTRHVDFQAFEVSQNILLCHKMS